MEEFGFKVQANDIVYEYHDADYDKLPLLACQIKVWNVQPKKDEEPNWFDPTGAKIFTEVESIDIFQSYKKLIGTATIKIPRGAIINVGGVQDSYNPEISSGNTSNATDEGKLQEATNNGELLVPGISVTIDGKPAKVIDPIRPDAGLIEINPDTERLINKNDFAIGNRIEIWLGYLYEPEDLTEEKPIEEKLAEIRAGKTVEELTLAFTGFITGISPTTPLEIKCENMASVLKKKSSPEHEAKKDYTVNDFLGKGSTFDMLKGTGLKLSEDNASNATKINLGKVNLHTNHTVMDILEEWQKCGIVCMMENDGKSIKVGRLIYSGVHDDKNDEYIDFRKTRQQNIIQFDWDVAEDRLTIINSDKQFLAVDAVGYFTEDKKTKSISVTVRKDEEGNWDIVNEKEPSKDKKSQKFPYGNNNQERIKSKVDLDTYTRVPYVMSGRNATKEELIKQAKAYYNRFNMNGISGSISLFGDKIIYPSDTVCLLDPRQPEKNGYYLVESVQISFDDKGYRRELKIPYKTGDLLSTIQYVQL